MKGGNVQPKFLPNYTAEQRMSIEKAESILAEEASIREKAQTEANEILAQANVEKEHMLAEAKTENVRLSSENERLIREIEERKQESQRVLATYAEQQETLRLNDEAQAIIESADAIRAQAKETAEKQMHDTRACTEEMLTKAVAEAESIQEKAKEEAKKQQEQAEREAKRILTEATQNAQTQATAIQKDAKKLAQEILDAAHQEEARTIERKESVAEQAVQSMRQAADAYGQRVRQQADEYAVNIRLQADRAAEKTMKKAEEQAETILESAQELIDTQQEKLEELAERLHADEMELNARKASVPEEIRQKVQERTAAMQAELSAKSERLAQKEGELCDKEEDLTWNRELLEEEKRAFAERLEEAVSSRYGAKLSELAAAREHETQLVNENLELNKKYNKLVEQFKTQKVREKVELQNENERLKEELAAIQAFGITVDNARAVHDAQNEVKKLRRANETLGEKLTEALNAKALAAGTEEKLSAALASSDMYQRMVEDLMRKLDERKSVSRTQMLLPIQEAPKFLTAAHADMDPEDLRSEISWLEHIRSQSDKSGIKLSSRRLYAYHTSLKIREWSPLVVLAGVSGTGKSELPKQYARHGGMHFLSVPVKPDWDSPASLFGYFNAIENRFEATELLRALYQMQEAYKNEMLLVLLDEMNLAHPEQYFADLLSKFEECRGSALPAEYDIMLGAGERPEKLAIGGNVLWTGTMNEDETTKALSDKVIDRSVVITFPRPKKLYDRDNVQIEEPKLTLSRARWDAWRKSALIRTASADLKSKLDKKKEIISEMNAQMSIMGRNLGHRVWQSIENYILNYPSVIATGGSSEEIDKAFCDAVAFKMMPKLRGLETQGSNEEQLDKIRETLPEQLQRDFDIARNQTSEVFRWNSAEFMEEE